LGKSWINDERHEKGEHFVEDAGLLYRTYVGYDRQTITQLVVPNTLRNEVMRLAHDSIMSGRPSKNKKNT